MPFQTNGKRNYKRERQWEHTHGTRMEDNKKRVQARRAMIKAGKAKRFDGKQVDHIKPLISGGGNGLSNLRSVSAKTNLKKEAMRKKRK